MSIAGKLPFVGNLAIKDQFRVTGTLELFENHFVHAAAGVESKRSQ